MDDKKDRTAERTEDDRGVADQNSVMEGVLERLREVNEKVGQLTEAVEHREVIGQAKGILMERYGITADQAFALLVSASTTNNTKLRQVATALVDSGELRGFGDR